MIDWFLAYWPGIVIVMFLTMAAVCAFIDYRIEKRDRDRGTPGGHTDDR